jgi:hypothetical protein
MSSFPRRFLRSLLGPKFVDTVPVENPEADIGARQFNAAFHAVAGMNLVVPRAVVIASYTGSAFQIDHQAEAWNPEGSQGRPLLERASAGAYTYTFAATYKDQDGVNIATSLTAARVTSHRELVSGYSQRVFAYAYRDGANPLEIKIRLWDAVGTGIDAPFWLEVF